MRSASPEPSTRVVSSLVTTILRAWPSSSRPAVSSLRPTSSEMTWPPVRMAMSSGIALRRQADAEARGLDGHGLEGALELVDHEDREGLALDVLGDDRQRLAGLDDLLQQRQQVLDGGDLGGQQEDVGILEHGLLAVGVGDEVG